MAGSVAAAVLWPSSVMETGELVKTGTPSGCKSDMVGLTAVVSMVMVGLLDRPVSCVLRGWCKEIYDRIARVKVPTYALGLREGVASSSVPWPSMAALAISREDPDEDGEDQSSVSGLRRQARVALG